MYVPSLWVLIAAVFLFVNGMFTMLYFGHKFLTGGC